MCNLYLVCGTELAVLVSPMTYPLAIFSWQESCHPTQEQGFLQKSVLSIQRRRGVKSICLLPCCPSHEGCKRTMYLSALAITEQDHLFSDIHRMHPLFAGEALMDCMCHNPPSSPSQQEASTGTADGTQIQTDR